MNTKILIFVIISLALVIPSVYAQEASIGEKAKQKSVKVTISDKGDVHVKHVVSSSNSPKQLTLIEGIVENLTITDEKGEEQLLTVVGNNDAVIIFPSNDNSIIEYDLSEVLVQKNNVWTWDFLYLQTTSFMFPEELDLIFVNDRPVHLDKKNGISCHGCQMILEYSINEPKNIMNVKWEDQEFFVAIRTFAEIENFNFDQPTKQISFNVNDEGKYVTTIIPLELLWEPYAVFLDDEKIYFNQYINNGTHVWVNLQPDTTGKVTIIGTTVIPEFPIIAPLAIGFLIILVVPLIRKVNLH